MPFLHKTDTFTWDLVSPLLVLPENTPAPLSLSNGLVATHSREAIGRYRHSSTIGLLRGLAFQHISSSSSSCTCMCIDVRAAMCVCVWWGKNNIKEGDPHGSRAPVVA